MKFAERLVNARPPIVDLMTATVGLILIVVGVALIHLPSALITAGVGLFYLGALHR